MTRDVRVRAIYRYYETSMKKPHHEFLLQVCIHIKATLHAALAVGIGDSVTPHHDQQNARQARPAPTFYCVLNQIQFAETEKGTFGCSSLHSCQVLR